MSENTEERILVAAALPAPAERGRVERGFVEKATGENVQAVSVSALKANMQAFLRQLGEIIAPAQDKVGAFELSQVEVAVQITGDGQVYLLGVGAKIEVQGGVKFVLKRAPQ